jgi:hypothetical protein
MMPGVVELATLHENAHHVGIGSKGRGGYIRYFDEGCCNFLAYLIYFHKRQEMGAVGLYRSFLQEINTELYEHPSFDRIMASIVSQIGLAGVYQLLIRRLEAPESIDWRAVLCLARRGELRTAPWIRALQGIALPPVLEEMQHGANQIVAMINSPDPVQMSPIAYLAFDRMCQAGSLSCEELRHTWKLTPLEMSAIIKEVEAMDLWVCEGNEVRPAGRSDLFRSTGFIRAANTRTVPWMEPQ